MALFSTACASDDAEPDVEFCASLAGQFVKSLEALPPGEDDWAIAEPRASISTIGATRIFTVFSNLANFDARVYSRRENALADTASAVAALLIRTTRIGSIPGRCWPGHQFRAK
jgi:hypothetical protein